MTQPMPGITRAHKIAALHAFAEFFAANPLIPIPESLTAVRLLTPEDEQDERTRVSAVTLAARAVGQTGSQDNGHVSVIIPVLRADEHGINGTVTLLAELDEPQREVYV